MDFKTSETAQNLLKAFAGESQARNRYTFAASIAKKEGFEHIAAIFTETAANEKEHAKLFFAHLAPLAPEMIQITASYPVVAGDTKAQLKAARDGENEEWSALYPEFAAKAKEEGFADVARTFEWVSKVEKEHESVFSRLLTRVENGTVFKREEKIFWRCLECGHMHEGTTAPGMCPVCKHPQAYFAPVGENF
ncbi:MAG: rubrerythrin family protein [Firmicutes bacterium]|nr:rubrerythrin family protein [Bacillota bacterium]